MTDFKQETRKFFQQRESPPFMEDDPFVIYINNFASKQPYKSVFMDYGGGNGQATKNMRIRTMFNIDYSLKSFHNRANSIIADGENLPLKDRSVDSGIAVNVFHHMNS